MNPLITKLERRDRLSEEERQALRDACTPPRRLTAGQDLIREGARTKESTLVLEGYCVRYNDLRDGARQITAIHIAGDFVDLHSFLLHKMDHGVAALTDCLITTIPHDSLRQITERYPHLTRLLWLSTLIDAAIHRRWLVAMGRLPAAAQLAHLLCELQLRLKVMGLADEKSFDLPLTQTELADVLGLSLVHVNRVVQELRREGLIAWSGRRVTLLDRERLWDLAEFDPGYLHLEMEPR
jgi:CRP-like cAMP-binding protein